MIFQNESTTSSEKSYQVRVEAWLRYESDEFLSPTKPYYNIKFGNLAGKSRENHIELY